MVWTQKLMFDNKSLCWQCNCFAGNFSVFLGFSFWVVFVQLDLRKRGMFQAGISAPQK
jgi:hypothetical protein